MYSLPPSREGKCDHCNEWLWMGNDPPAMPSYLYCPKCTRRFHHVNPRDYNPFGPPAPPRSRVPGEDDD